MDKKSKILLVVFMVIILASITITYYRFFVNKNYFIYTQVSCDPLKDSCYSTKDCPSGDNSCDQTKISYYKIMKVKAYELSSCNINKESCPEPSCKIGDQDCQLIKCDQNLTVGAESCGDTTN